MTASRLVRRGSTALVIARLTTAYLVLGLLKPLVPLTRLAPWMWREPRRARNLDAEHRVLQRILRARRFWGMPDRDCVQRSLLLYRELSRAGANPVLVAGFRRTSDGLQGHAWVVVDGRALAEMEPDLEQFVPALRFGPRGALIPGTGSVAA